MHEASIAENILEIAIKECLENGYGRIERITVEIGLLNAINRDSLLFAFNASKRETIAEKAELEIIERAVSGYCHECKRRFTVEEFFITACPFCNGTDFIINQGRELNIIEMEVAGETEGSKKHT